MTHFNRSPHILACFCVILSLFCCCCACQSLNIPRPAFFTTHFPCFGHFVTLKTPTQPGVGELLAAHTDLVLAVGHSCGRYAKELGLAGRWRRWQFVRGRSWRLVGQCAAYCPAQPAVGALLAAHTDLVLAVGHSCGRYVKELGLAGRWRQWQFVRGLSWRLAGQYAPYCPAQPAVGALLAAHTGLVLAFGHSCGRYATELGLAGRWRQWQFVRGLQQLAASGISYKGITLQRYC